MSQKDSGVAAPARGRGGGVPSRPRGRPVGSTSSRPRAAAVAAAATTSARRRGTLSSAPPRRGGAHGGARGGASADSLECPSPPSSSEDEDEDGDEAPEEDEDGEIKEILFEVPEEVLPALKAAGMEGTLLPIELCADVPAPDEKVVEASAVSGRELCALSSIRAIAECGRFYIDEDVPVEFAAILESSTCPLMTHREIVDDPNSIHGKQAKASLLRCAATEIVLCDMFKVFEEACGRTPPSTKLTLPEKLTGVTGGVWR